MDPLTFPRFYSCANFSLRNLLQKFQRKILCLQSLGICQFKARTLSFQCTYNFKPKNDEQIYRIPNFLLTNQLKELHITFFPLCFYSSFLLIILFRKYRYFLVHCIFQMAHYESKQCIHHLYFR
jgi:hypothetical protein